MHSRETYKSRIEALGSLSAWAREMGVDRKTIERQCSGRIVNIKRPFWLALHDRDGLGVPELMPNSPADPVGIEEDDLKRMRRR